MKELNIAPLSDWGLSSKRPIIISGPCSAESEEQVITTVLGLKDVDIIRAGIWKPRTRPGSFEGRGKVALPWIKAAGEAIGKPVAVEVATREHVEDCLKAGIDILWIGARTTVNPFSVQEIADALQAVDIPVMVKNPVNPDLQLWIGALERVNRAGITKIAAIHRGFSSYNETVYRNKPMWEFPVELKRLFPELPLFNDPSHICGNTHLLGQVAQKALDLEFDGLMIESHCNPKVAFSDAAQQVTPDELKVLLSKLVIRKVSTDFKDNQLDDFRSQIDRIDHYLIQILKERTEMVKLIGEYKRENNLTILQNNHWDRVIQNRLQSAIQNELNTDFVKAIFDVVHKESIRLQNGILNEGTKGKEGEV